MLAQETQGVYHYCGDATHIPRVFVREAENIKTLAAIEEPPIQPRLGPQRDFLADLAEEDWPMLEAALSAKPKVALGVEVSLLGKADSPLLARWRIGLGNVTAYMSDAKPAWSRRWMEWPAIRAVLGTDLQFGRAGNVAARSGDGCARGGR